MSTVTDESIKKLQETLSAKFPGKKVVVEHRVDEGDRISVSLPEPEGAADALVLVQAINAQQEVLASVVEAEAGLRLRRTKAEEAQEESTADAIVRDEPYQGQVQYLVQLQGVSDKLKKAFEGQFGTVEIRRVDFVDARVAEELRGKGVLALLLALALIIGYMALRFDVFFAPGALIATMHDPILALGLFVFGRVEFDQPSIAAMLTIIGYSVNGTIVIYDRIRETMPAGQVGFEEVKVVVNRAINDTFSRSINTVMTTLFTTVAVAVFTEGAVHNFALTLSVGFVIGTISSVLIAPTVYLFFRKNFYNGEAVVEAGSITREDRERGVV
jgi:preprotein translocase SecF subunit